MPFSCDASVETRRADGFRHAGLDEARRPELRLPRRSRTPSSCRRPALHRLRSGARLAVRRPKRQPHLTSSPNQPGQRTWTGHSSSTAPAISRLGTTCSKTARRARLSPRSRAMAASTTTRRLSAPGSTSTAWPCRPAISASTCSRRISPAPPTSPTTLGIEAHRLPLSGGATSGPTDAAGWRAFGRAPRRHRRHGQATPASTSPGTTTISSSSPLADGSIPQEHHPRRRARHRLGDGRRLGGARRRRSARLDREIRRRASSPSTSRTSPAGESADEDGWADVGHGTIDWAGLMAALRAKTPARYFIMEHDNPNDHRALRRAARSQPPRPSEEHRHGKETRRRRHRLRQHLDDLFRAARRCSRASRCAPAPTSTWLRPRRGRRSSALRAETVDGLLAADGHRHRRQPHDPGGRTTRCRSRRSTPASTSIRKSPSCCRSRTASTSRSGAEKKGLRIGSAPDTFLGGSHQLARHLIDSGKLGKITSRHLPRHEPRHGALASRTRTSSSSRAAGRCSTSGPTTSPI